MIKFFDKLLGKHDISIIPIKEITDKPNCWGGNGIVFYVENGKGILHQKYGTNKTQGLASLVYDDVPLSKFHGDGYFCPTCEKLISAGYGIDKLNNNVIEMMRETLNRPFMSIKQSLKDLEPLLGLLPTGYYGIADVELYPIDGNGKFFWTLGNTPKLNKASCPVYDDGNWSEAYPQYILPTQPPRLFNRERAEFYRGKDEYRAIAYYLDGYLCALLDGHHKAVAAALDSRTVKTLVILPTNMLSLPNAQQGTKGKIGISGIILEENELLHDIKQMDKIFDGNQMSEIEFERYMELQDESFGNYDWTEDILKAEHLYLDAFTIACIEWVDDLSDSRLDKILNHEERCTEALLYYMAKALSALKNPRFKEIAFFICKNEVYSSIWKDVYSLLSKIKDEDVENFFIDYLVSGEIPQTDIKKIIDDYFRV